MSKVPNRGDNELSCRMAAHMLRRACRQGRVRPGMEEIAEWSAELFSDMAQAEADGTPEVAKQILREAIEAFDDDNESEEAP